ncbi:hypothetical protein GH714_026705 [Hevea brasiliensis]|uniref:Uncharacterized protein n=1 Tax=Hevea brasiliensis TaxID=3981 RepID=A0A6A6M434_HEVBR|nr:hypothetical protein GH714_026705 [Hevea brasiliensis]
MEDQAMEWENRGYEGNIGKVSWIFDKGLAFGKKMLITGFVLSSAPVVLPPLVVISALGFACSVPYGLFLATYACTEKIMNKLLPSPRNPIIVEDGLEKYGGEDGKFGGNNDMEEEETELKRMAEIDAREIADESAFNLFDDKNAADLQNSSVDYGTPEGSEQPGYKLKENADSLELNSIKGTALEHSGISDQVPYSDENIWKQIDAMRTILGYTAARHRTCIEEVKALYIFTGVGHLPHSRIPLIWWKSVIDLAMQVEVESAKTMVNEGGNKV